MDHHASRLAASFEQLVQRLLRAQNYRVLEGVPDSDHPSWRIDFSTKHPQEVIDRAVDVKWLPVAEATPSLLRAIIGLYEGRAEQSRNFNFTLIISAKTREGTSQWIRESYGIDLWDRQEILRHAQNCPRPFAIELEQFFRDSDARVSHRVKLGRPDDDSETQTLQTSVVDALQLVVASDPTEQRASGRELCGRLKSLPRGATAANKYERICQEILGFLFEGELADVQSQKRTEDGINIFDMTYRITNSTDFWRDFSRDFRCRVLVVECKNYNEPIRAMQVFTTERYISLAALRSVAFILTRIKPHETAYAAAQGALREAGKLIIFLTDDDLCQMLHLKDDQRAARQVGEASQYDPALVINRILHSALSIMPR